MKLGARELIFFAMMLGLVVSTVLLFQRWSRQEQQRVAVIEQKEQALENLKQATSGIEDLDAKIADLQKAIAFFESKLPQEKEVASVLKEVSNIAESNSLQTRTFRTMKTERTANYSEQPIKMSLSGDFNGFYSFLLQLEKLPRITRLLNMKLEKISDRDGEMQAQLTLSIFFEPESTAVASGS